MAQPTSPSLFVVDRSGVEPIIDPNINPMELPGYILRNVQLGLAPISGINVGAAAIGSSSEIIYLGINVEFPGLPLHYSIHAVQFLVTNLILNHDRNLRYLAISSDNSTCGPPCGHCRQFLQEIRAASEIQILIRDKDHNEYVTLDSLLPRPDNLFPENYNTHGLTEWRYNGLTLLDSAADLCAGDSSDEHVRCNHLKCRALWAANKSYAPYSKCPSGMALRDCDGEVYIGWYMESYAFNPSLGPSQAALVDFVVRSRGKGFDKIVEAVLIEMKDPKVRQEDTTRMIFGKIAHPDFAFSVLHCSEML